MKFKAIRDSDTSFWHVLCVETGRTAGPYESESYAHRIVSMCTHLYYRGANYGNKGRKTL